jgi:hypothetical protein
MTARRFLQKTFYAGSAKSVLLNVATLVRRVVGIAFSRHSLRLVLRVQRFKARPFEQKQPLRALRQRPPALQTAQTELAFQDVEADGFERGGVGERLEIQTRFFFFFVSMTRRRGGRVFFFFFGSTTTTRH